MLRLQFESLFVFEILKYALDYPIFGHILKSSTNDFRINNPSLLLRVIIWTRSFFTPLRLAFSSLIKRRMILLLLPSMTHITSRSNFTSTIIIIDIVLSLPIEAWLHENRITIG